jgi:hypothetical protein
VVCQQKLLVCTFNFDGVESSKFVGANFGKLLNLYGFCGDFNSWIYICKKDNSGMYMFVEDVNSCVRATQEFHEDYATANFNDSTVIYKYKTNLLILFLNLQV